MRSFYALLSIICFGCSNAAKENKHAAAIPFTDSQKLVSRIVIGFEHSDTLVFSGSELAQLTDSFPTLDEQEPQHPDSSFAHSGYYRYLPDTSGKMKYVSFGSEVGQDNYFLLYTYFLRKKNIDSSLITRRQTLIKIFNDINVIFATLNSGGTFFGHQVNRIYAYAEFAVYEYSRQQNKFNDTLDFRKQKTTYLNELRKKIMTQVAADPELNNAADRSERQQFLLNYLAELDKLISDDFYLDKVREFQHGLY